MWLSSVGIFSRELPLSKVWKSLYACLSEEFTGFVMKNDHVVGLLRMTAYGSSKNEIFVIDDHVYISKNQPILCPDQHWN
jgi:hypothetical protein